MTTCSECPPPESPWYEQPMNETIRDYARSYISPVKMFYKNLDEAMSVWGTQITEDEHERVC